MPSTVFASVGFFEDRHVFLVTPDLAEHPLEVVHLVQGDGGVLHLVLATVLEGASDLFRGAGVLAKREGCFRWFRKLVDLKTVRERDLHGVTAHERRFK